MSDPLKEMRTIRDLLWRLDQMTNPCWSLTVLARSTKIQEDLARRTVARFADALGDSLISFKGKGYKLTDTAREWLMAADNLLSIGRHNCTDESVHLEIAPGIAAALVTDALKAFIDAWGDIAAIRVGYLDEETIQLKLNSGETSFGIAWLGPEVKGSREPLTALRWRLFVPSGHRFEKQDGPVAAEQFLPEDRVLVAANPGEKAAMDFAARAGVNRIVVDSEMIPELVSAGTFIGLTPEFSPAKAAETFVRKSVDRLEPLGLSLLLPRKKVLSEPARSFVDLIRTSLMNWSNHEPATGGETPRSQAA